jgi:hypothetical protein
VDIHKLTTAVEEQTAVLRRIDQRQAAAGSWTASFSISCPDVGCLIYLRYISAANARSSSNKQRRLERIAPVSAHWYNPAQN